MHRFVCCVILALLAGCSSLGGPNADPSLVAELSKMSHPAQAPLGEDLDILVIPESGNLRLVNRTPHTYTNMQLWLNQQYVGLVERIDIGTDNTLSFNRFINRHGEPFPTGSFLQPDAAFPVVMAELFDPATNRRHRLLARRTGL